MIIVDKIENATHVTHGGLFHADDVMATAICIINRFVQNPKFNPEYSSGILHDYVFSTEDAFSMGDGIRLYRANDTKELEQAPLDAIIYDIGNGKFDHHSKEKKYRENGIPYASAGLLWKEYGEKITAAYGAATPWVVDSAIIEGIDARDNGCKISMTAKVPIAETDLPVGVFTVSDLLLEFNPNSQEALDPCNSEIAFIDAVAEAAEVLHRFMQKMSFNARNAYIVEGAIRNAVYGRIIVLPFYISWMGILENMRQSEDLGGVKAAVFPSQRGGYQWAVEKGPFSVEQEIAENYGGLKPAELREYFPGATFIHPTGFTGGAETLDQTINMALQLLTTGTAFKQMKGDE